MDEFTKLLMKAIEAKAAFERHECDLYSWCPRYDIGCEEAERLSEEAGDLMAKAIIAIENAKKESADGS